jgi:hypothetical protein
VPPRARKRCVGFSSVRRPLFAQTTNFGLATAFQGDPLPTVFTCLFCNHENSVTVKIDKKAGIGSLECKVCGQRFSCTVNCTINPEPISDKVLALRANLVYGLGTEHG